MYRSRKVRKKLLWFISCRSKHFWFLPMVVFSKSVAYVAYIYRATRLDFYVKAIELLVLFKVLSSYRNSKDFCLKMPQNTDVSGAHYPSIHSKSHDVHHEERIDITGNEHDLNNGKHVNTIPQYGTFDIRNFNYGS